MTHTRIIGRENCEAGDIADQSSNALQAQVCGRFLAPGTRLHEFEIIDVVAMGGFGIVYRAQDHSLDRKVAIKEYMPAALAERTLGVTVSAISSQEAETFQAGLQSFVNEAHLLARFDHPALLKVFRFWEGNGTAYMAMPLLDGKTLRATLAEMGRAPDEPWLKSMLAHLLDGLEMLHGENCFHRDIAPDNILVLPDGKPLLLDFGAARRVIGDRTQLLTVILKPGYAPPEQYADAGHVRQGAWTDIYALAGVLYFAITGLTPLPSIARMIGDTQKKLVELKPEGFSHGLLAAVDQALSLAPQDRPQSISHWRSQLGLSTNGIAASTGVKLGRQAVLAQPSTAGSPIPVEAGTTRRLGVGVGLLGVVLLVGFFWWTQWGKAARLKPLLPEVTVPLPARPDAQTPPVQKIAPPVFDPLTEVDRMFKQRDQTWDVALLAEKDSVRIGLDKLKFRITSDRSGYVYVLMVGTNRNDFSLIFPNEIDSNNHIVAHRQFRLPRTGWSMTADGPAGSDQFLAIVSDHPRDFSASGMIAVSPFAQFNPDKASQALQRSSTEKSPFVGIAVCPETTNCSQVYGAATLTIREVH